MGSARRRRWLIASSALLLMAGAAAAIVVSNRPSPPEPTGALGAVRLSEPTTLCVGARRTDCRPVEAIREAMASPQLAIVQAAPTPGGVQGATVLTLRTPQGLVFDAKWRSLGSASGDNDPAAELAADRLQQLLLGPDDLVIPPAATHCFAHDRYERQLRHDRAPLPGTRCVLGFLSLWLTGAVDLSEARRRGLVPGRAGESDPGLYDPARFQADPTYRRNLAHLNLIAFLMAHGDAHAGQFVAYEEPAHVFLVDNSVAFGLDHRSAMEGRQDLARLLVPAIPADTADRLRALTEAEVQRLQVLAELRDAGDEAVPVEAGAPFGEPDERLRRSADRLQIGLTDDEIAGVWRRVLQARAYLADGALGTF